MSQQTELPELDSVGLLRYTWRQLTSMRTALILLLMLGVASIPGSLVPQRAQNPIQVGQYFKDSPELAKWMDRIYLFDVYGSPWFSAIYILLFISLIGCVLPRTIEHFHAARAFPPATPKTSHAWNIIQPGLLREANWIWLAPGLSPSTLEP